MMPMRPTKLVPHRPIQNEYALLKRVAAGIAAASLLGATVALCVETPPARGTAPAQKTAADESAPTTDSGNPNGKSRTEVLAAERYELLQRHVAAAEIHSEKAGFPEHFRAKPIFRYSDPTRGHLAAAVWKLGDEGRPKAILTSELDRFNNGRPSIFHEYTSLTTTRFSLALDAMHWTPSGTHYEFKPIPGAPKPELSPQRRMVQIREIAKRFAGREVVKKENCELRLLPQPVDRYVPSKVERADGAIFFFTFGTNPEVMLLIESDGKQWNYAAGRMTGAEEVSLKIDDDIAWQGAPLQNGADSPYTGSVAPIDIPGIAADGREIDE